MNLLFRSPLQLNFWGKEGDCLIPCPRVKISQAALLCKGLNSLPLSQKQNFPRHVLLQVETWIYSISVEFDLTSHLLRQEEMSGPITASGIFKAVVEADAAVVDAVTSVDIVNVTLSDDVSISPNG